MPAPDDGDATDVETDRGEAYRGDADDAEGGHSDTDDRVAPDGGTHGDEAAGGGADDGSATAGGAAAGDADDLPLSVAGGSGTDEPLELGDRRKKHVSVTTADGDRVEHGDVYVRHAADGFVVSEEPDFTEPATTRYEKSGLRRVEVTQHHSACFITTATAGEGPALEALRGFRDDAMARTPVGRLLVGAYYAVSPPVARTLARHPGSATARAVRWLVDRCAALARRREASGSRPARAAASMALTLSYAVGLAVAVAGHAAIRARERLAGRR